ncbi:alpha-glucuronidase family glycosyl hydrolase [Melioribacter sp. OK-6-Me]|uniref:alpha-glucuronidase family glycosyl hydrolase n=1 Tax=unclassified Melioribacter TaxID=2627329 RepID=UPI003ED97D13
MKYSFLFLLIIFSFHITYAEDGYNLWLRYNKIDNPALLEKYLQQIKGYLFKGDSESIKAAEEELKIALKGLLGNKIWPVNKLCSNIIVAGNFNKLSTNLPSEISTKLKTLGKEGYIIKSIEIEGKKIILITANEDIGVLYGTFHFIRLLQTHSKIDNLNIVETPLIKLRLLNHWDNLDRTVERGYAGFSIWNWHLLPDYIDPRYKDYARANASIGINGTVLTNVNANSLVLTKQYLIKVAALAKVFRPYGIKVYLTARFSAPMEIGNLPTADPLNPDVRQWWKEKAKEIYDLIPDFGGFLVKANSEGQPGPQNYGRNHADGANMLAEAVHPYGGVVMWRAFVYDNNVPEDRAKQAYNEFKPLDGKFRKNVLIQVKNGPIDFQPREPFHPLFGAMPQTSLMMEFQITQEYLGQGTHLVYLAPLFEESLNSDTYARGEGSTVAKVIDGSLDNQNLTGIAGVSNIGNERNWTGHLFGQANWYAFGRIAWNHNLTSDEIAEEWIRLTFNNNSETVHLIKEIMMQSRENTVNYMTPLGLHHIMGWDHHYGPAPWIKDKPRADWTSVYYHRADSIGIGFDRTINGSNAVSQYHSPVSEIFNSLEKCPEKYLLWFHHVPWNYKLKSGKTLWEELCNHYYAGVDSVRSMRKKWNKLKGMIDNERFNHVAMLMKIQEDEAIWWRNACVLYFQKFSKLPVQEGFEKPDKTLEYYQSLEFPYAPGIRPK